MAKKKTQKKKSNSPIKTTDKEAVIILSIKGTFDDVLRASIPATVPNKK